MEKTLMMAEKIQMALIKRKMTKAQLAEKLQYSPSNIYNKLKRDNFSEKELVEIGKVLDCTFQGYFKFNDTGDII
jgi:DNA-binding Xre family transcriptional regulator